MSIYDFGRSAVSPNEALLKDIRSRFDYMVEYWAKVREEGKEDMRCVAGDPWPKDERDARKAANRLCLSLDELNQYLNACINGVRQNKRAIKVVPEGNGADNASAEWRSGIIRGIEYKCKAQNAYIRAFENAIQRSYGYVKITTAYESPTSSHQVIKIVSVPNPDMIYLDPDALEADFSDMGDAFELDNMTERAFAERWPKAEIRSFSPDHMRQYPRWILPGAGGNCRIQVASYWKVHSTKRKLIYLPNNTTAFLDEYPGAKLKEVEVKGLGKSTMAELPSGEVLQLAGSRDSDDKTVWQYITNGLEILEKKEWFGDTIPIVPCHGKELWIDEGSGAKRILISLVRMARQPYLVYCYARTAQAELAGQAPRNVWMGYEGQFDTKTPWETINRTLITYAEVKAQTAATGDTILPLPQKNNFEPPIQALELLAEAARRAIQSAMGVNGLLSGKRGQDQSAKSGVALRELDKLADEGTFHFIDNYNMMIEEVGRKTNKILHKVYDKPRDVVSVAQDDTPSVLRVNEDTVDPQTGKKIHIDVRSGDHGVTLTTAPPFDSQRQEASLFTGELAANPNLVAQAIAGNQIAGKILGKAIRLKQLGAIGDQMADILDPPEQNEQQGITPEIQQAFAQKEEELQRARSKTVELNDKLEAKIPETESKERIEFAKLEFEREKLAVTEKLELAKLGVQSDVEQLKQEIDSLKHTQKLSQEERLAAQKLDAEAEARQAEQAHDKDVQAGEQAHETVQSDAERQHAEKLADKGHEQTMEQAEQAADLAPEPAGEKK